MFGSRHLLNQSLATPLVTSQQWNVVVRKQDGKEIRVL